MDNRHMEPLSRFHTSQLQAIARINSHRKLCLLSNIAHRNCKQSLSDGQSPYGTAIAFPQYKEETGSEMQAFQNLSLLYIAAPLRGSAWLTVFTCFP